MNPRDIKKRRRSHQKPLPSHDLQVNESYLFSYECARLHAHGDDIEVTPTPDYSSYLRHPWDPMLTDHPGEYQLLKLRRMAGNKEGLRLNAGWVWFDLEQYHQNMQQRLLMIKEICVKRRLRQRAPEIRSVSMQATEVNSSNIIAPLVEEALASAPRLPHTPVTSPSSTEIQFLSGLAPPETDIRVSWETLEAAVQRRIQRDEQAVDTAQPCSPLQVSVNPQECYLQHSRDISDQQPFKEHTPQTQPRLSEPFRANVPQPNKQPASAQILNSLREKIQSRKSAHAIAAITASTHATGDEVIQQGPDTEQTIPATLRRSDRIARSVTFRRMGLSPRWHLQFKSTTYYPGTNQSYCLGCPEGHEYIFTRNTQLQRHAVKHVYTEGNRMYRCGGCARPFDRKDALRRHMVRSSTFRDCLEKGTYSEYDVHRNCAKNNVAVPDTWRSSLEQKKGAIQKRLKQTGAMKKQTVSKEIKEGEVEEDGASIKGAWKGRLRRREKKTGVSSDR